MKPVADISPLVKTLESQPLESGDLTDRLRRPKPQLKKTMNKKFVIFPTIIVGFFLFIGLVGYLLIVPPVKQVVSAAHKVEASIREISPLLKSQNLVGVQKQLIVIKNNLTNLEKEIRTLSWASTLPVVRDYYEDSLAGISAAQSLLDAGDLGISAIAPYADVIGLKGLTSTGDGGKTAQDRINFIVNTLDKLQPEMDKISLKLEAAKKSLSRINPLRYPEDYKGQKIRSQISEGINIVNQAATLVTDAKPLLGSAPYLLGIDSPRKYLLIFQNDAEIRPTGGFMTGYAVISVSKGKISTIESNDIYKLDQKFPKLIPAPKPILQFQPLVPYWHLRDMNLSPDFRVSMETFMPNYALTKSPQVDGVIAVDTQVLVDLLKVTGPIGAPGLGNFSANTDPRCNCPNVFLELQLLAGGEEPVIWDSVTNTIIKAPANYGNRKAFLGPLMYSVLANVMAQPKSKMPLLIETGLKDISGKHVQMYFFDPKIQAAAESFDSAGRVRETNGDYLMVVDTNFSGAKTNIWVAYTAEQKVEIQSDGSVTDTLTLTYSNPQEKSVKITQSRDLNGKFRDWLRVYVPKGSQLIEARGYESGQATGEDLDKTVFEAFFTLDPGNTKILTFKYKLPLKLKNTYQVLVQKQGGSKIFPYNFTVNNRPKPEVLVDSDKNLSYPY